jgi:hypothetical protein
VLFVVKGHTGGVKIEEVPDFVGDVGSHLLVSAVLQPDLEQSLLSSQGQGKSQNIGLFKLLSYTNLKMNQCKFAVLTN